jgi:uncharacterized membrane protein
MTDIERPAMTGETDAGAPAHKDVALILLGASLLGLAVFAGEYLALPAAVASLVSAIRLTLGLVYVLYAPGYCLTTALLPRVDDLDGIERAGLGLGLSVAWSPVLALILDQLPWGLSLEAMLAGQLASVVVFAAAAVWRRERLPDGEAYAPEVDGRPRVWWRSLPALDRRVFLLCGGALLVAGLAAAWIFLAPSPDEFMTEFYVLGRGGLVEDYPRQATAGQTLAVTMGITNRERETMTYRVEVWAVDPWTGRRELVNEIGPFTLSPGETVAREITWQMPRPGDDLAAEFYLFAENREGTEPYRSLQLWLDVD